MTTTITARIWSDLGGRCVCDNHLGNEASFKLAKRPSAKTITTSMTKWAILRTDFVATLSNEFFNGGTVCESCREGR